MKMFIKTLIIFAFLGSQLSKAANDPNRVTQADIERITVDQPPEIPNIPQLPAYFPDRVLTFLSQHQLRPERLAGARDIEKHYPGEYLGFKIVSKIATQDANVFLLILEPKIELTLDPKKPKPLHYIFIVYSPIINQYFAIRRDQDVLQILDEDIAKNIYDQFYRNSSNKFLINSINPYMARYANLKQEMDSKLKVSKALYDKDIESIPSITDVGAEKYYELNETIKSEINRKIQDYKTRIITLLDFIESYLNVNDLSFQEKFKNNSLHSALDLYRALFREPQLPGMPESLMKKIQEEEKAERERETAEQQEARIRKIQQESKEKEAAQKAAQCCVIL